MLKIVITNTESNKEMLNQEVEGFGLAMIVKDGEDACSTETGITVGGEMSAVKYMTLSRIIKDSLVTTIDRIVLDAMLETIKKVASEKVDS